MLPRFDTLLGKLVIGVWVLMFLLSAMSKGE